MTNAENVIADFPATAAERDVLAERRRQIEAGHTPEHDDRHHEAGELASAAMCYARSAAFGATGALPPFWPWSSQHWKPSDPRRDLVKAGALILAEIERIDRAEAQKGSEA